MKYSTAVLRFAAALLLALLAGLAPLVGEATPALTWTLQHGITTNFLQGIACPSPTTCFAAGAGGAILATADGWTTWTAQSSGTTNDLSGIAGPRVAACFAVGNLGTILAGTGSPRARRTPTATAMHG